MTTGAERQRGRDDNAKKKNPRAEPADSFTFCAEMQTYAKLYKSVMSLLFLSYIQNWLT